MRFAGDMCKLDLFASNNAVFLSRIPREHTGRYLLTLATVSQRDVDKMLRQSFGKELTMTAAVLLFISPKELTAALLVHFARLGLGARGLGRFYVPCVYSGDHCVRIDQTVLDLVQDLFRYLDSSGKKSLEFIVTSNNNFTPAFDGRFFTPSRRAFLSRAFCDCP